METSLDFKETKSPAVIDHCRCEYFLHKEMQIYAMAMFFPIMRIHLYSSIPGTLA